MSRTRQQVIFRIHELRIKANAESHDPPPSYEDSQKKNPSNRNAIKKNPADDNENTSDSKRMSCEQLAIIRLILIYSSHKLTNIQLITFFTNPESTTNYEKKSQEIFVNVVCERPLTELKGEYNLHKGIISFSQQSQCPRS